MEVGGWWITLSKVIKQSPLPSLSPSPKGKRKGITFHHHFDEVITFDPHESGERPAEKVASARKVELRDPSLASPGGTYF
jgi:hypothetical protein